MHLYSPLSKGKSLLQCDKYISSIRTVISSELTLVTPTNSALQTSNPLQEFSPDLWSAYMPVARSSHIIPDSRHTAALTRSSLKLHVPSLPHHKSCQNNQTPKRHHPRRHKRVNQIWGKISSFYLHSILHNPYHWQVSRQHTNQPLSFPLPSTPPWTCKYHSHHEDGNCMSTITTETLQQSAPLLYITILSLCSSLELDIFQFHFNSSHYLRTFS